MLVLLLCFSAACNTSKSLSESPSFGPSEDNFPTDLPGLKEPSAEPSIELSPTSEPMSYEEYFSELRPIEDRELRFEKWDYDDEAQSIRRMSDGKIVATDVLTRWDFCMAVNEDGLAYCAGGEKVYLYNDRTEETELLYQSDGEKIEFLDGGGPVVFFDVGQKIYRIYLPDGTLDFMCDRSYTSEYNEQSVVWAGEENSYYFDAISNTDVCFSVMDAGWYVDDAAATGMDFSEWCSQKFESGEAGPMLVWYSSILGKYICGNYAKQTLGLSEDKIISDVSWYTNEYLRGLEAVLS